MHAQQTSSTLPTSGILGVMCLSCPRSLGRCRWSVRLRCFVWPILWSLARYLRSHVWFNGARPRTEALVQHYQQFAAKVRWKWHFRGEPRCLHIHLKHSRTTPPYPHVTSLEPDGRLGLLWRDCSRRHARPRTTPGYNSFGLMSCRSPSMDGSVSKPDVGCLF